MKTRKELAVIAANLSDDIVTVQCMSRFQPLTKATENKLYTYKAPRSLAKTLEKGDTVLVERSAPRSAKQAHGIMRVVSVDDECILDDPAITYHWLFAKIDLTPLNDLIEWESAVVEKLYRTQRQRAKQVMLAEIGAEGMAVPRLRLGSPGVSPIKKAMDAPDAYPIDDLDKED